ncbi:hypothetical protein NDI85_15305 [Halomicroarcula sp. S1AR25-4]|uniref:hypothetical protein n=1 Tax=Haloarcula sp. S1AR25-4 TaxID=2950538 RepID=UPI0028760946|nr:hypothetical protein [Halomicroarcula sp. S1AR25-4]MDS0279166.1 hypothetical protein [Halomicroarcula sp. S1AR25-4]
MRRRQFLAAVAVGATLPLAGCSDPRGSIRLTDVSDDAALADRWAIPTGDLADSYRDLAVGAIEDDAERATVTDTHPPFDPTWPIAYEGSYYAVDSEATNERTRTQYGVESTVDPDPTPERTVAYADLPAVDREKLDRIFDSDTARDPGETLGVGVRYTDAEAAESVVVPEPEYDGVTRDGATFGVAVRDSREVTVADYRYRAELLARDATGLAAIARERFRFSFDGLSADQRAILDDAKNGEAESEDPPSEAFTALVERFRAHDDVAVEVSEYSGTWLVRYDGADWWAEVRYPEEMRG